MIHFAPWKIVAILLVCLFGIITAAPNLMSKATLEGLPDFLPQNQINLGLDLQGGAHLLLEVDVDSVIQTQLESLTDSIRDAVRAEGVSRVGRRTIEGDRIIVPGIRADEMDLAVRGIRTLDTPVGGGALGGGQSSLDIERIDSTTLAVSLSETAVSARKRQVVAQSIEVVRRRVDETGTLEPNIQRQGDDRILLQIPGEPDSSRIKDLLGQTARLTFHDVDENVSAAQLSAGRCRPGADLLYEAPDVDGQPGQPWCIKKRVLIDGSNLNDAQVGFSQNNETVVNITFDGTGARLFADHTRANVGRPFAIVLDGEVLTAPVIRQAILGGTAQISGNFTIESANDLALLLRAGALPADLEVVEERTVGPDLGSESVAAGEIAGIVGLLAVIIFIILAYGGFGLAADIALAVNVTLIVGLLSILQATLTLPGIAGIVLTIGMAVDANVLVFERIREELKSGKSPLTAIDMGYSKALSTILDANITTLIAAILLYQFGSGPVKGFAVTLAIGIVTSVFTAVFLTRMIVVLWMRSRRPATLKL